MTDEQKAEMHDDLANNADTEEEYHEHRLEAARLRAKAEELDPTYDLGTVIADLDSMSADLAQVETDTAQGHAADLDQAVTFLKAMLYGGGYGFTFGDDAGESYQNLVWYMGEAQYVVQITTEDGEVFDAVLMGRAKEGEFYNDVRVQKFDAEQGRGVGEIFTVTAQNIHVY